MTTTLPILIQERDVGLFYGLLAKYHDDPDKFRADIENLGKGKDESSGKLDWTVTEDSEESPNFFRKVTEQCTCGKCFRAFARHDRIPWRSTGNSEFANAKHGTIQIPKHCAVSDFRGSGYIYISPAEADNDIKYQERLAAETNRQIDAQAKERKARISIEQAEEGLKQQKEKTSKLAAQNRKIQDDKYKQEREERKAQYFEEEGRRVAKKKYEAWIERAGHKLVNTGKYNDNGIDIEAPGFIGTFRNGKWDREYEWNKELDWNRVYAWIRKSSPFEYKPSGNKKQTSENWNANKKK